MPKVEETPSHTLAYKHFLVLHQPSQESSDNFTSFCPWSGFVVRIYRALHLTQSLLWKSLASRHFCVCGFKPKGSSAMLKQPKNQNSSCQSCAHVNTHQTEPPQKNRWKPRKPSISSSESWLREAHMMSFITVESRQTVVRSSYIHVYLHIYCALHFSMRYLILTLLGKKVMGKKFFWVRRLCKPWQM